MSQNHIFILLVIVCFSMNLKVFSAVQEVIYETDIKRVLTEAELDKLFYFQEEDTLSPENILDKIQNNKVVIKDRGAWRIIINYFHKIGSKENHLHACQLASINNHHGLYRCGKNIDLDNKYLSISLVISAIVLIFTRFRTSSPKSNNSYVREME